MNPAIRVDLLSDTQTRPTPGMRAAMAEAEVGDEQRGDDPSVNRLCARVADLLGKEAALFLPSGTMANQVAILVHCAPGDEILAAELAHIFASEAAGVAALAGVQTRPLQAPTGIFTPDQVRAAVRPAKRNAPRTRLVALEQTVNRGGGRIWPLAAIEAVAEGAREAGLLMHMDGARLLNAAVATGIEARAFAAPFDSLWLDLSKGLGCPAGAVMAGTADFVERAWQWKQRLGGAMRQAGVLAAAGLHALDHHVARLAEDHDNARAFAARIAVLPGVRLDPAEVETNLVFFDLEDTGKSASDVAAALTADGVRIGVEGPTRMRAVTHLDVDRAGVEAAAEALSRALVR
ncbi:MAG: aminotransferase class I/II-fold pyridoxal phosphate-dependent enzyme [Kiloniellales bacterium]|nr:aminotransferase class I/II-fold pyridoxal phosphate-dependent enzyme [Kiloniellales bacterium]